MLRLPRARALGIVGQLPGFQGNAPIALKCLMRSKITKPKHKEHIVNEKQLMVELRHPFLVNLVGTLKDAERLFLAMEYIVGGELFGYMGNNDGRVAESVHVPAVRRQRRRLVRSQGRRREADRVLVDQDRETKHQRGRHVRERDAGLAVRLSARRASAPTRERDA